MKKLPAIIFLAILGISHAMGQSVSNVSITGIFTEGKVVRGNFTGDPGSLSDPNYRLEFFGLDDFNDTTLLQAGTSVDYLIKEGDNIYRLLLMVVLRDNTTGIDTAYSAISPQVALNSLPSVLAGSVSIEVLTNLWVGEVLLGKYIYTDADSDPEGDSQFRWIRNGSTVGSARTYLIQPADEGENLSFEVTPVASAGNTGSGAAVVSPAVGPVNSAPYIIGQVTIASSVVAGEIIEAGYLYFDPDGDEDDSEFTWYRDGAIIGGADTATYTTTADDAGKAISVTIIPKSKTGYPDTGEAVSSNICTVQASGTPLVTSVCISGERKIGSILRGNWEYEYTSSLSNSTEHKWFVNGILVDEGSKFYEVKESDLKGEIVYQIKPYANNGAVGDSVRSAPMARFNMPTTYFSNDDDEVQLVATPGGGIFSCDSGGVFRDVFILKDRIPGQYKVQYTVNRVEDICSQTTYDTLTVGETTIEWNIEERYCWDDGIVNISVSNLPPGAIILGFTIPTNPAALVDPVPNDLMAQVNITELGTGYKKDYIEFTYFDPITTGTFPGRWDFVVDSVGANLSISIIDDQFCENAPPVQVSSGNKFSALGGGSGSWSSTLPLLSESNPDFAVIDPSLIIGGGEALINYTYTAGGCSSTVSVPVTIFPKPVADFMIEDRCIDFDGDTIRFRDLSTITLPDTIKSWLWDFGPSTGTSSLKNPGYVYKTGGIRDITLEVTSGNDCVDIITRADTIARMPVSDFSWEDDCFYEGEDLKLIDNSGFTESLVSAYWVVNDTDTFEVDISSPGLSIEKKNAGIIGIDYYLETLIEGCSDVAKKDIYVRPVYNVSEGDYYEDFESPELGWFTDRAGEEEWSRGIPSRFGIDPLSTDTAWYTSYDILNQGPAAYSVESPCFDFRGATRPMIKMDIMRSLDEGRDGAVLQYRVGNSPTWENIGGTSYGIEWYDNSNIYGRPGGSVVGWSPEDKDTGWKRASQYLDQLIGFYDIKLRVAYGSDGTSQDNRGFAFDNIWIGQRKRNVLVEHFTNSSTPGVVASDILVNGIIGNSPDDAVNIQYHTNYMPGDPFYFVNTADPSARVLFYGLSRVPYSIYDGGISNAEFAGRYDFSIASPNSRDLRNRSMIDPEFIMAVDSVSPDQYAVKIKAVNDLNVENVTLYFAVVAKEISSVTGDNGQDLFKNVLVGMYPDAGGINLASSWLAISDTTTVGPITISHDEALYFNADSIGVIAFLQNNVTREIYQAVTSGLFKNRITAVNKTRYEEAGFTLFPNPAGGRITFLMEKEVTGDSRFIIYNNTGIKVMEHKIGPGTTSMTVDNPGLANGIYLVRMIIDGTPAGYRKLIIAGR